tara:strand:+ start:523 stop:1389 length:867 start_codon:yes stop_codon:yes gene_type:complete
MKEKLISILSDFDLIKSGQSDHLSYKLLPGITNTSYLVDLGEDKFVVRIPGLNPDLLKRSSEYHNQLLAVDLGITLPFIYFDIESGIKVSKFITGLKTFTEDDFKNKELRKKALSKLLIIHESDLIFKDNFDPLTAFKLLSSEGKGLQGKAFSVACEVVDELLNYKLESKPCHQDLYSGNFVLFNEEVYLIDWEYSSQGDPFFDYSDLFMQNNFDQYMRAETFTEIGIIPNKSNLRKSLLFEALSLITWGLWSIGKSVIDKDVNKKLYYKEGKNRVLTGIKLYENKIF